MTTFDDRKKGAEHRFVHDQEVEFKVLAKRNRLLGEWAAAKMHMEKDKIKEYAESIVQAGIDDPKHQNVTKKLMQDFEDMGIEVDAREIEKEMANLLEVAKKKLKGN